MFIKKSQDKDFYLYLTTKVTISFVKFSAKSINLQETDSEFIMYNNTNNKIDYF